MKSLLTVFKFEFLNIVNNKSFKITTLILAGIILIGLSFPLYEGFISSLFTSEDLVDTEIDYSKEGHSREEYGYIDKSNGEVDLNLLENYILENYNIDITPYEDDMKLRESVSNEDISAGFIIKSNNYFLEIINDNSMYNMGNYFIKDGLEYVYKTAELKSKGIDYDQIESIVNINVLSEQEILGVDGASNYWYTYMLNFAMYMMVILYGQIVATSIASEKSTRAMELLITSTNTKNLIFGKVYAVAAAGILQISSLIFFAKILYEINSSGWDGRLDYLLNMPISIILTYLVFGILGFLLFLFMFAIVGALVSRTEDVGSSSSPIMFMFLPAFFLTFMSMGNPDGLMIKILSFIPFSSYMAMFARVSLSTVPIYEVFISLLILLMTTVLIGVLASRIYRIGTLNYGDPLKFTKAFKLLFNKES